MYKVILIDDETYVLQALKNSINWNSYNMEVIGTFDNSINALLFFKKHNVDLVITDILMPQMNGISLIEKMKELNNDTLFIILSAHDKFDYALQAIKLSVTDYILKPIDYDKFEQSLKDIEKKLTYSTKSVDNNFDHFKLTDIVARFFTDSKMTAEELYDYFATENIFPDSPNPPTFFLQITLDNLPDYLEHTWKHGIDRLYSTINYFLNTLSLKKLVFIPLTMEFDNITFFCIIKTKKVYTEQNLAEEINNISKSIIDYLRINIDMNILKLFSSLSESQKVAQFYVNLPEQNSGDDYDAIGNAINYIHEHYKEDISLSEVSKRVCLTPYHFCRLFKKETGENLIDYINRIRIENAKNLIIATNESITAIYKMVGFNSKNHFYKLFKEFYNMTPQQYRTEYKKGAD